LHLENRKRTGDQAMIQESRIAMNYKHEDRKKVAELREDIGAL
jgi:hypothetical protein